MISLCLGTYISTYLYARNIIKCLNRVSRIDINDTYLRIGTMFFFMDRPTKIK